MLCRARQIFAYFKKYNYQVVETGEVIKFEGVYGADKSQAASLIAYTFVSKCPRTSAPAAPPLPLSS